jgi:hypothetical protein
MFCPRIVHHCAGIPVKLNYVECLGDADTQSHQHGRDR